MRLCKISVFLLGISQSIAFAGTMGVVCGPGTVTVPCPNTGWSVSGNALYLQPSYTGALAFLGTEPTADFSPGNYVTSNPDWRWGFQVGAAYYFNTGNDLSINWYHIDSPATTKAALYTFGVPLAQRSFEGSLATIQPSWDAANLELGQLAQVTPLKTFRFHGGFQYARIATTIQHIGIDAIPGGVEGDFDEEAMQYSGFGPRLGMDMSYFLSHGISVYAKTATAVLVGSRKTNSFRTNTVFGDLVDTSYTSVNHVVTEVDMKLGLQYDYALTNSTLSADAGYMWVNYFQPLAQRAALLSVSSLESSNFGLQGVYFGLKWNGTGL